MTSKQGLRLYYRSLRSALSKDHRAQLDCKVCANLILLLQSLPSLGVIASYSSMPEEIDLSTIFSHSFVMPHSKALPIITSSFTPLIFCSVYEGSKMIVNKGILEPVYSKEAEVLPDILFVPLLACDIDGNRLGYGKAYYDITLMHLRSLKKICAIGVAYEFQVASNLICEPHDQKLDIIVTDEKIRLVTNI